MIRMLAQLILAALASVLVIASAEANPSRWQSEGWKTDFTKSSVDFSEIMSGGPPRDGIPPIDNPKFIPVIDESSIPATEPVSVVTVNGETRGYPLRIMTWHEIVNDEIAGVPVAITYCPLCNASIVFNRTVGGKVLDFGTTGKLRNSDLVMYDRQTDSWWQQFTGSAIVGSYEGTKLEMLPSFVTSFEKFSIEFPDAKVLVPTVPGLRDYGRNPYAGYDSSAAPFLYRGEMPPNIGPMARVVVVQTESEPFVVSLGKIVRDGYSKDGFEISWENGVSSALDKSRISESRDVGGVRVTKDGKNVVHDVTFAFVAHAFYPEIPIIIE